MGRNLTTLPKSNTHIYKTIPKEWSLFYEKKKKKRNRIIQLLFLHHIFFFLPMSQEKSSDLTELLKNI